MKYAFWRIGIVLGLMFVLGGCLLEHAPSGSSRSINTWLLGVWDNRNLDGSFQRVWVLPLNSFRYALYVKEFDSDGKSGEARRYEAWISRVGQASLLVIEVQEGASRQYLVLGYQLLSPIEVRIRTLELPPEAAMFNGFRLRAQIRRQFKEGTLFARAGTIWTKVSEVYWQKEGDPTLQPFQQLQNVSSIPLQDIQFQERP